MSKDERFLSRWSRLKQDTADETSKPAPDVEAPAAPALPATGEQPASPDGTTKPDDEALDLSKLPSIESLTRDSDYSVFMRKGIPDDLRRKALYRLYVTNPELAAPDLMDMNALDYTGNDGIRPLVIQPFGSAVVAAVRKVIESTEATAPQPQTGTEARPVDEMESAAKPDQAKQAKAGEGPKGG